ncbi:carboxypeptidase regulatory-like domain-containing protein [Adhaeretor mobilis]|uniref:Carboxypeptidase regulatory-like domain-containing protein n=1 Tax=Adhaeretor mobilis TaxID=1930276 RepID=A0A517MTQ0_9BACT|nr:carboxypeptidase regulatory-like domain-containing protein [Adhaeretor mobilis]QDS98260.1 hypothetical protein HG15A2_15330 [Adhaeretor mobilis]
MNSATHDHYRHRWTLVLAIGVFTLGCAAEVETTQVSGQASYRDKPIAGGVVNFFPATGGRPIAGIVDDQGHYEANLPAGDYTVAVQSSSNLPEGFKEGDPLPPPDPYAVPVKYQLHKKSGLKASIAKQSEVQEVNFELK